MPAKIIRLAHTSLHVCARSKWPWLKAEPCSLCDRRAARKARILARARERVRLNGGKARRHE